MAEWLSENWFSLLSIVALIAGGAFAFIQWNKTLKVKRSEFIHQIIERLRFDEEMTATMYLADYDEEVWYTRDFHGSGKPEFAMDKLLSYLSYICYLIETRHITKKESSILEYELRRACESSQVQDYLFNLYHFSQAIKSTCSFQYLIDYGLKEGIIDKSDFMNKASGINNDGEPYSHNLSF